MSFFDSLVAGVSLVFILCLVILPFALLGLALWARKKCPGFTGRTAVFFAGHSFTFSLAVILYIYKAKIGWDALLAPLPLFVTALYLLLGAAFRLPKLWLMGISTPGLWLLCQHAWVVVAGQSFYRLPQDPIWYFLGAGVLFGLPRIPRFAALWGEVEDAHVTASGCYAMGALWLPAVGQAGVLGYFKLAPYVWALALLIFAAFLFWAGRIMRDQAMQTASAAGVGAGVYALIAYFTVTLLR